MKRSHHNSTKEIQERKKKKKKILREISTIIDIFICIIAVSHKHIQSSHSHLQRSSNSPWPVWSAALEILWGSEKQKRGFEIADSYKYIWIVALIIASQLSFVSRLNREDHRSPHSWTWLLDTTRHRSRQHLKPFKWSPLNIAFLHKHFNEGWCTSYLHNFYLSSLSIHIYIYLCVRSSHNHTVVSCMRWPQRGHSFITFHSSKCNEWAVSLKKNKVTFKDTICLSFSVI